jgi:tRNA(Ile)-lysidine synthase TilS/MesJ
MNKEIENKVYDKYPVTDKERNCRQEREKRNWLRHRLTNWLEQGNKIEDWQTSQHIQE